MGAQVGVELGGRALQKEPLLVLEGADVVGVGFVEILYLGIFGQLCCKHLKCKARFQGAQAAKPILFMLQNYQLLHWSPDAAPLDPLPRI